MDGPSLPTRFISFWAQLSTFMKINQDSPSTPTTSQPSPACVRSRAELYAKPLRAVLEVLAEADQNPAGRRAADALLASIEKVLQP